MEALLQQILSEIQGLKEEMQNFRRDQYSMKEELQNLRHDQNSMREEMQIFRHEQNSVKAEMESFKYVQEKMKEELAVLSNEQQATKLEMGDGFTTLHKRVERLESHIESEVIDKIRALFDAREVLNDNINDFRDEFNWKLKEIIERDFNQTVKLNKIEKMINLKNIK